MAKVRNIGTIRELTSEDLGYLGSPRAKVTVNQLRESHHRIARLYAIGMRTKDIAEQTGYSVARLATLRGSPAFKELIADKSGDVDAHFGAEIDAFHGYATRNMLRAERQISDRLDEADELGETLPVRELVSIVSDRADRFGYGKKAMNVNLNLDFAGQLERAIARSGKTIEGKAQPATTPIPPGTPVQMLVPSLHIRRRI